MDLILFGPPGCGKGTQSDLLCQELGYFHISTGKLCREAIAQGSQWGLKAQSFIDRGHLVPDEMIIELLWQALEQQQRGSFFILDGFPRTLPQAEALHEMLAKRSAALPLVVSLQITEQAIVERLTLRGRSEGRSDDAPELILERLKVYHRQTAEVLDYCLQKNYKVVEVSALGTPQEVFTKLKKLISLEKKLDLEKEGC